MRIFLVLSLSFCQTLNGDILRVTVPYNGPIKRDEPIENEMILLPLPILRKSDSLQPIFGETRDTEVFFNDIPLNDPSAPRGMADLQYLHIGRAYIKEGGVFNLSSNDTGNTLGKISISNLGPEMSLSLPYKISPFAALACQNFPDSRSRQSLNAGVKGIFSLTDIAVDFSLIKIKGENKYKDQGFLHTSKTDQNGASIKIVSLDKVFVSLKHMDIERTYGNLKISGQTDTLEAGAFLFKNNSFSLKVLREQDQDQNRTLPSFLWKNENLSLSMGMIEKELYPEFWAYFGSKTLFFEAIAKKRPPKLSELVMLYEKTPGNWITTKSELTSETLLGARAGWGNNIWNIEAGTDFLISPILYNYETWKNFNGPNWGKPFFKTGLFLEGSHFQYKYTCPYFISHPSQMINVPIHHFNWTWNIELNDTTLSSRIDILTGIKRYDEIKKSIINNGYESRIGLKIDHKPFFIKIDIINVDPSQKDNDLFIFSAGVNIHAL